MTWVITVGTTGDEDNFYKVSTKDITLDPDDLKSIAAFVLAIDDFKPQFVTSSVRQDSDASS